MEQRVDFIEEILQQAELADQDKRIALDRAQADRLLMALHKLDSDTAEIESTAEAEVNLIESWKRDECSRIEKKRTYLCWQLEQYIKSTDQKTITLAHGSIRLRLGRDKVEIVDIDQFMKAAKKYGLLRTYPEYQEPDLRAVAEYVKKSGEIPPGVELTPAITKFTYQLNGGSNGKETKAGTE